MDGLPFNSTFSARPTNGLFEWKFLDQGLSFMYLIIISITVDGVNEGWKKKYLDSLDFHVSVAVAK